LNNKGYTLIELSVVVFLIGLMLFIAAPRVRDAFLDDSLKSAARKITGAAKELRNDAVREQVDYVLHLDLSGNSFWTCSADMTPEKREERRKEAYRLRGGVKIADVYRIGHEKKSDGEATVRFFKRGYAQPYVIHLAKDDRNYTLVINPFLSAVTPYEKYIDVDPGKPADR
jgi:general secretion pathway protein H